MDASLYSAMSAAKQLGLLHEINTNNIANANTNNFKQDNVSFSSLYLNGGNAVSTTSFVELSSTGIDLTHGSLKYTGNNGDVAVGGDGFFELKDSSGASYFLQSLKLMKNQHGYLINADGGHVLDQNNKTIDVGQFPFKTNSNGNVVTLGKAKSIVGSLKVVSIDSKSAFKMPNGNISVSPDSPPKLATNYSVMQGYQVTSNVNSVKAMATMIETQKDYEIATKAMNTIQNIHKTSNSILE